jgi:RNA polymerase sigma factor (sigma-70 family)
VYQTVVVEEHLVGATITPAERAMHKVGWVNLAGQIRRSGLMDEHGQTSDGRLLQFFVNQQDEQAFAVLVRRHGPMVFGVCRRILANTHDAEDAFQATFLVVVQKAASLTNRQTIGNWLHGVSYKTALKARALRVRRQQKEREMAMTAEVDARSRDVWNEVAPVLDEELRRLPDRYREPIVLCDLEGKSRKEAAHQLGWPEGTVAGRLARGRVQLAERLKRRGVTLAGGSLASIVSANAAAAAVPTLLEKSTLATARHAGSGQAITCVLAKSVLRDMSIGKFKLGVSVVAVLVATAALATGVARAMVGGPDSPRVVAEPNGGEKPASEDAKDADKLVHVWSVAWSPDGKHIASAGFDGAIRIWSREGELVRVLKGHQRAATSVAWGPDGTQLASAGFDGTVRVWKSDGTPGPVMEGHNGVVATVAWSADGTRLASGGFADNTVRIWRTDGKPEAVLKGHTDRVHSVAWHPRNNNRLASGSYDGTVRLWDVSDGKTTPGRVLKGGGGRVYAVAWGQGGILLAAANHDGSVGVWDLGYAEVPPEGGPHARIKGHNGEAIALAFSPDGWKIASAGADTLVRIWEDSNFKRGTIVMEGHNSPAQPDNRYGKMVHSVGWSPDQKHIVSGGMDGTIRLWDAKTGKVLWVRDSAPRMIKSENP